MSNAFQRAGQRLQLTAQAAAGLPVDEAQPAHDEATTPAGAEEPDPAILRLQADIRLLMGTPPYPSRAALEYVKAFLTDHRAAAAGAAPVPAGAAQTVATKHHHGPVNERAEKIRQLQADMEAKPLSIGSRLAKKDEPPQTMRGYGTKLAEWRKRSTSSDGTNGHFFIEQDAESDYRFDATSRRQPVPDFVRLAEQKRQAERFERGRQR